MMKITEIMLCTEKRTQSNFTAKAKLGKTDMIGLGQTKEIAVQNLKELLEAQTEQNIDLTFLLT